ncbi:MAG: acyl carrier protein [Gammaproteobacteria bacterium]|nr:acyl carrier protein [Gammaproteobacteria bacterium]
MLSLSDLEVQVGELIIETLNLDMEVNDIDPDDYLFGEGLGLDSIDALELAMAISNQYNFQLRSDDANNRKIFRSLKTLADYIDSQLKIG